MRRQMPQELVYGMGMGKSVNQKVSANPSQMMRLLCPPQVAGNSVVVFLRAKHNGFMGERYR